MTSAIETRDLTKSFPDPSGRGTLEILHGLTCSIPTGRMTAMVGPSGSGKSTALLCLAGLEPATTGSVHVLGEPLNAMSPGAVARLYRDRLGFVFQAYNLVPYLTVAENVTSSDELAGRRPDRAGMRATLEDLGLAAHAGALTNTLSGGQQQRVALARVLYRRPEVVFADEPTGALDTRSAGLVLSRLRGLADAGHTVVLVTHDLEAASLADGVLILRDGRIAGHRGPSTPQELLLATTSPAGVR